MNWKLMFTRKPDVDVDSIFIHNCPPTWKSNQEVPHEVNETDGGKPRWQNVVQLYNEMSYETMKISSKN